MSGTFAPLVEPAAHADEIQLVYPHRSALPADAWSRLFSRAEKEIGILAYSALFLAEDFAVSAVLREKARAGVRVRIALGEPTGVHITERGFEEDIGNGMTVRIPTALTGFRPVIEAGAEVRLHDTVLYNSIFRTDDQLLVNPHIHGHPAAHSPVFHFRLQGADGTSATYLDSFELVWERVTKSVAKPHKWAARPRALHGARTAGASGGRCPNALAI